MVFAELHHPRRVLVAMMAVAGGALGCADTTTPKQVSNAGVPEPSFTVAVGFVGTPAGRGALGPFDIHSKANGFDVKLKSHDNTDIAVTNITVAPGGHSGWHYHPGPAIVVVKTGAITFYHGDDPTCSGSRHPAGTAFIEAGGVVGIARNEEPIETTVVATFFAPTSVTSTPTPTRFDAARPGNCPF